MSLSIDVIMIAAKEKIEKHPRRVYVNKMWVVMGTE
jgi:hypothetical protein